MNNLKIGFSVGQGMMLYREFPLSFREIVVAFLIWKEQEAYKAAVLKRFFHIYLGFLSRIWYQLMICQDAKAARAIFSLINGSWFCQGYGMLLLAWHGNNNNNKISPSGQLFPVLASLIPLRVKTVFMFKGLCSFIFLGPRPRSYFGRL